MFKRKSTSTQQWLTDITDYTGILMLNGNQYSEKFILGNVVQRTVNFEDVLKSTSISQILQEKITYTTYVRQSEGTHATAKICYG